MKNRINHTQSMTHVLAKKVFSTPEITAQFMNDILEVPVREVKLLSVFESLNENKTSITVLVQLASESKLIVEIQTVEEVDLNEAFYLYLSSYFTKNNTIKIIIELHSKNKTNFYRKCKKFTISPTILKFHCKNNNFKK